MTKFLADVRRFAGKTDGKMTTAVRKITLDAFSEVIMRSPVDTGRFRGNWQTAIGSAPANTIERLDPSGAAAIADATAATATMSIGDVAYLSNNLPYGPRLEDGSSKQAPQGMVRLAAQRAQAIADRVIAELARQ